MQVGMKELDLIMGSFKKGEQGRKHLSPNKFWKHQPKESFFAVAEKLLFFVFSPIIYKKLGAIILLSTFLQ